MGLNRGDLKRSWTRGRSTGRLAPLAVLALAAAPVAAGAAEGGSSDLVSGIARLSIEELANIEISSVSKHAESLSSAPAAIYVITNDAIRRSGRDSLPEMLRLAPNLQVAAIGSRTYAVTARGFMTSGPNKLLVLIDGRTVYTPLFSGVFWDAQDVMAQDLDRIEVISGPGGTLWGANAVNGVINIISRNSRDSQGVAGSVGAGPDEKTINLRYGGRIGDDLTYRVYGKAFARGNTKTAAGTSLQDDWNSTQAGGRMDLDIAGGGLLTVQGDWYDRSIESVDGVIDGHNVLARWTRPFDGGSQIEVQAYYDHTDRSAPGTIGDRANTFDLELQHHIAAAGRHSLVWGGGYRLVDSTFTNIPTLQVLPPQRRLQLGNAFIQDEVALTSALKLTVGIKAEHNSYTGMEYLPSGRLAWTVAENTLLWGAISRAVRTPSRIDRELYSPPLLTGAPGFVSEKLTAYEIGVRMQPLARLSFSISGFYNRYDDLRSLELSGRGTLPLLPKNGMKGNSYGVEIWGSYALTGWWRASAGVNTLHKNLRLKAGSLDISGVQQAGNDPAYQFSMRSSMDLGPSVELDLDLRHVASLPNPQVPSYTALDSRLGWKLSDHFELAVSGFNLTDGRHPEIGALPSRAELGRTFYVTAQWTL
jgi:iron complex outermembrane receptor protein